MKESFDMRITIIILRLSEMQHADWFNRTTLLPTILIKLAQYAAISEHVNNY